MDCLPAKRTDESAIKFVKTFPKTPALVRHPVRCGKPNCRCATGERHESWRLVWWDRTGRQRHRYVPKAELDSVRAIVEWRRAFDRANRVTLADMLRLLKEFDQSLKAMQRTDRR